MILWGVGVELISLLAIVYTPWGNALFGAAPLPLHAWLPIVPFMGAMLLLEELRKRMTRR